MLVLVPHPSIPLIASSAMFVLFSLLLFNFLVVVWPVVAISYLANCRVPPSVASPTQMALHEDSLRLLSSSDHQSVECRAICSSVHVEQLSSLDNVALTSSPKYVLLTLAVSYTPSCWHSWRTLDTGPLTSWRCSDEGKRGVTPYLPIVRCQYRTRVPFADGKHILQMFLQGETPDPSDNCSGNRYH